MPEEKKNEKRKDIFLSTVGTVVPGSLKDGPNGSVSIEVQNPGKTWRVVGYKDKAEKVRELANSDGEILIRGVLGGSKAKDSLHIMFNTNEPRAIVGKVSNIRRSEEPKQPYINALIRYEVTANDGKKHTFSTPLIAFGDKAEALNDLKDGDTLNVQVRERHQLRQKDGKDIFVASFEIAGSAVVAPAAENAAAEAEAAEPATKGKKKSAKAKPETAPEPAADSYADSKPHPYDDDIPF